MKIEGLRQGIESLKESVTGDTPFERGYMQGIKCALMYVDVYADHAELEPLMVENTKMRNNEYPFGRNDYQE